MPLNHLHLEMIPWDGGGVMFNDQLVVWWIKLQGAGIHFLQEMGHGHGDLHVLAWFQAIASKGQRSGDTRPVTTRHRVASQGLHHCPLEVWHLFELLPREHPLAPRRIHFCLYPKSGVWMGEQGIEHETQRVRHGVDAC